MEETRKCPKCNSPLKFVKPYHVVPRLPAEAILDGTGPIISFNAGYPVEVWCCEKCRYVEMYAAGRAGAEK
jgi:uncharacterized protein with PIN domain